MNKRLVVLLILACCADLAVALTGPTPRDQFWSAIDLTDVDPNPILPVTAKGYGQTPNPVQYPKASPRPLGLRYSVLKRAGSSGPLAEVVPSTIFHSGDTVKVCLMANQSGYIYIIQQGSSGNWHSLFPTQADEPGSNRVEAGKIREIPPKNIFQFDKQTGMERLFILLSRQLVPDLDQVIFTLSLPGVTPVEATKAPLVANDKISDALVQAKSRDLKEVQDAPQEVNDSLLGENAMYVVNPGDGSHSPSQVFAKLVLEHR